MSAAETARPYPGADAPARPIRELPERVAAQIAAGEVVERPAAALKELVENALDAGAERIAIAIGEAGRERIEVHDDGCGIAAAELTLACRRHATSKLEQVEDLARLGSYGFRGEALPAIAAAAGRLRITSRARGAERAALIEFERGAAGPPRPAARAVGTSVEVRELFANQPARRAFLAGPRAERAALVRVVSDAALAQPRTSLRLEIDGRVPLRHEAAGAGGAEAALREALAAVFSEPAAARALWLEARSERGEVALDGLCGQPADARRTRDGLRLFVNGRPVQDRRLAFAAQQACRDWIPDGRFPLAALRLTVPPEAVDVNIHPAKTEVKLRDHEAAFALVRRAIREALSRERYASPPVLRPRPAAREADAGNSAANPRLALPTHGARRNGWPAVEGAARGDPAAGPPGHHAVREPRTDDPRELRMDDARESRMDDARGAFGGEPAAVRPGGADAGAAQPGLPPLRMIGQLHRTFIIAEGPRGLTLIDQHAAHERVLYERLLAARSAPAAASQPLLTPILLPLDAVEAANWLAARGRLAALSLDADLFGERTLRLRALPAALDGADAERLARGVLADLGPQPDEPERFDRAAASAACHGSIRRGAVLDAPAMAQLLRDLERCRQPHHCPHGRPTLVEIPADDVLRQFGRR